MIRVNGWGGCQGWCTCVAEMLESDNWYSGDNPDERLLRWFQQVQVSQLLQGCSAMILQQGVPHIFPPRDGLPRKGAPQGVGGESRQEAEAITPGCWGERLDVLSEKKGGYVAGALT